MMILPSLRLAALNCHLPIIPKSIAVAMIAAAHIQHIWKCIERCLNATLNDTIFVNSSGSSSIYKWMAFSWLVLASISSAGDVVEVMSEEEMFHCSLSESSTDYYLGQHCVDHIQHEVWEISTRHLPQSGCVAPLDASKFRVSRWMPNCGWIDSSFEQYLASVQGIEKSSNDDTVASTHLQNVIYVHGNWMPADLTRERGLLIYRHLAQRAHFPLRLTIFSWPSTREKHALADVKENATVAEVQGLYLGSLLKQLPVDEPLGIIGFSYGARAVTGSLHALGGGTLCGRLLPEGNFPGEIRISLMAAAIDRSWLQEGGRHQKAAATVTSIVNLYNSSDPILRRYHLISSGRGATAAGVAGLVLPRNWISRPPGDGTRVEAPSYVRLRQFDCRGDLGRSHDEQSYYRECSCTVKLLDHVLWNDWKDTNAVLESRDHHEIAN